MYDAVRAAPDGASTVARLAATAREVGYDGLVVRNWPAVADDREAAASDDREATASDDREAAEAYADAVRADADLDLVPAAEIDVETPEQASGHVGTLRPDYPLLLVRGGTPALNRFAVESPRVDVLTDPLAGRGDVNHVLAKVAAENDVAIEFTLSAVFRADGGRRVRALQSLRKLRELVAHYDAPFVVSLDARSHLHLRSPRDVVAVGEEIGFEADTLRAGLAAWGELAARNRERQSEEYVGPGVRRGRAEEHEP